MNRTRLRTPVARLERERPLRLRRALVSEQRRCARHAQRVLELEAQLAEERRLAAIVAHDLRSPLHAVSVALTLLDSDGAADTRRPLRLAHASLARAGGLLDALFQLALPPHQRASAPAHARVRLSELIAHAADEARLRFPQRTLRVAEHDAPLWVDVDVAQMAQVLDNLISNALLHSPPSTEVAVQVCCQGSEACVSVENSGEISLDVRRRLFQPLNRGKSSSHPGSVGLGLHIAQRLVNAQNGRIELRCDAGRTCFLVFLPRLDAPRSDVAGEG